MERAKAGVEKGLRSLDLWSYLCYTLAITLITLNYRKLGVHEDFHMRTGRLRMRNAKCEMRSEESQPEPEPESENLDWNRDRFWFWFWRGELNTEREILE